MNLQYYRRSTCRLCDSSQIEQVLKLTSTPPGNNFLSLDQLKIKENFYPLTLIFCLDCKHVQLAEVVDPKILFQDDYKYVSGTSPVFVNHFKEYSKEISENYDLEEGSLVLDIGSNDGTCLKFFKNLGHRILGVDPATNIASKASSNGIPTIGDFFSEKLAKEQFANFGPAHLITSHNTCAHVDDLVGIFKGVRYWLHDHGIFIFEVGYFVDVFKNNWFDTIYHEHLDYHTISPLVPMFKKLNMEIISVKRISPQGGSIRVIVQKKNGKYQIDESIGKLIAIEEKMGLGSPDIFKNFFSKNRKS